MCVNHKIRITSFLKSSLENHQKRKIYMYCCTSWLICSRDIFFFTTIMIYFENISFFLSGRHLEIKLFKTYSIFQKPNRNITSAISSKILALRRVWIKKFEFSSLDFPFHMIKERKFPKKSVVLYLIFFYKQDSHLVNSIHNRCSLQQLPSPYEMMTSQDPPHPFQFLSGGGGM